MKELVTADDIVLMHEVRVVPGCSVAQNVPLKENERWVTMYRAEEHPEEIISSGESLIEPKPNTASDEWKNLDAEALKLYNERGKLSNTLVLCTSDAQRKKVYDELQRLTQQYHFLQSQKNQVKKEQELPGILSAKEDQFNGLSALEMVRLRDNLQANRSKKRKYLAQDGLSEKNKEKYIKAEYELSQQITILNAKLANATT